MADSFFRELRGDYVENTGQVMSSLHEYLDFFEPLGSALSRLPDGVGGPFVHRFTGSGGRVIGAVGWVVSAASKRYGGWKLWGMWTDRPIPALTLPLLWQELSEPQRLPALIRRANENADLLLDASAELFDELETGALEEDAFRNALKRQLSRAYAVPQPGERPIEVEVTRRTLELLPWLYLLGPIDPNAAQLQPSRFNGSGYQYILTDSAPQHEKSDGEIAPAIHSIVDTTADDAWAGWRMAGDLRRRRTRPGRQESRASQPRPRPAPRETNEMRTTSNKQRVPERRTAMSELRLLLPLVWQTLFQVATLALLAWIATNVHLIRQRLTADAVAPVTSTAPELTETSAPEPPPISRAQRIAQALETRPPQGIRIDDRVLADIGRGGATSNSALARVAVEIFLRRNACHPRTDIVDGKFSTTEQRAIRRCTALTRERLMKAGLEPDPDRAIDWLERTGS